MTTKRRVEQLTQEQEAQLATYREQWLAHGLSTERADRPRAEAGVRASYAAAGLEPPKLFIWLDSPLAGCIGAAMLANMPTGDQVGDQVWGQVGGQVGDQVGDQVRGQVRGQVRDQVGGQVGKSVWGQHDAGFLSFYDYMHRVVAIPEAGRLHGLAEVARSAGWWWPFAGAVILTERPTFLRRDADNQLHCADGPALAYPDGWSVYAWHGVRVPADMVTGSGWSVQEILGEDNLEIRRCAIERMGWDEFIAAADLRPVHTCPDPGNPGFGLALYDLPDEMNPYEEPVRVLLVANGSLERDGSRRRFGLTVPADIPTALAAASWGYDDPDHPVRVTPDVYATTARRS